MIPLANVVYDIRARNGSWCCHPYPGHSRGCPNFPKCPQKFPDFETLRDKYQWYAVIEVFDLKAHAKRMKEKHPDWTDRQCRNSLYWQGSVRKRLRINAMAGAAAYGSVLLSVPEACGVNVFETLREVGIILERTPDTVRKVMLVGK